MNREHFYNNEEHQQGFIDGRRTEGKIKKQYLDNLLKSETQNLSNVESQKYETGWHGMMVL